MKGSRTLVAALVFVSCIEERQRPVGDTAVSGETVFEVRAETSNEVDGTDDVVTPPCHGDGDCPAASDLCVGRFTCLDNRCVQGAAVVCEEDGEPCTINRCDPATGRCVLGAAVGEAPCSDDNACTNSDRCGSGPDAGRCIGDPVTCEPMSDCRAVGTCNPLSGACDSPVEPDGRACEDAPASESGSTIGACRAGSCRRLPALALGAFHGCALLWDDSLRCWGRNGGGQLGLGHPDNVGDGLGPTVQATPAVEIERVKALGLGTSVSCAITIAGLKCWGEGVYGTLGTGDLLGRGAEPDTTPVHLPPLALGDGFVPQSIVVATQGACSVSTTGKVKCWGTRTTGYPGVASIGVPGSPSIAEMASVSVAPPGEAFVVDHLVRADLHACALSAGRIRCWGSSQNLGGADFGFIGDDEEPYTAAILNPTWQAVQIASIYEHSCGVSDTGGIYCWGRNESGQLGNGSDSKQIGVAGPLPFRQNQLALKVVTGTRHSCALFTDSSVQCWGKNDLGQLGRGDAQDAFAIAATTIVNLGGPVFDIQAGWDFTCAVMRDGAIRCWGAGAYGRLGTNTTRDVGLTPGDMPPAAVQFD